MSQKSSVVAHCRKHPTKYAAFIHVEFGHAQPPTGSAPGADRSTRKLIPYRSRLDLIVVDELGCLNLRPEQSNISFKLIEERYPTRRCNPRVRQASNGPSKARNNLLVFGRAPQAQAEPDEMRRQQPRVG